MFAHARMEDDAASVGGRFYQCNQFNRALSVQVGGSLNELTVVGPGNVTPHHQRALGSPDHITFTTRGHSGRLIT